MKARKTLRTEPNLIFAFMILSCLGFGVAIWLLGYSVSNEEVKFRPLNQLDYTYKPDVEKP